MDIQEVADIIHRMAEGFEESCADCLDTNKEVVVEMIQEQLYSGLDGEDRHLTPTYDNDPYFNEMGYWFHRAAAYKAWKREITPPIGSSLLGLPPRPDEVPNLFIDGTFYNEIEASKTPDGIMIDPGDGNGPDIMRKYGDNILRMGPDAKEYFILYFLIPSIERFFNSCGYR